MGRVRILSASDAIRDPAIRARWEELLDQYAGGTQYYQSPGYFEHLYRWDRDAMFLAVVDGDAGPPIGIAPIRKSQLSLAFELRDYPYARASVSSIQILGGTLLMPQSPEIFELLLRRVAAAFPDCRAIGVSTLSVSSPLWDFVDDAKPLSREFMLYVPNGLQVCHTTRVPDSLDEYFGAFNRKRRYNLRRQVNRLDRFGNGSLKLQRIDQASLVGHLHDARVALAGQVNRPRSMVDMPEVQLLDLAERGMLLSYVLSVNDKPCALAFGLRFRETLSIHSLLHDSGLNSLSPGTVLQTLMMRDVVDFKLARRVDYGLGAPRYRSLNDVDEHVTAFLVRRGMLNQLLLNAHRLCSRAMGSAKRCLQMVSPAAWEATVSGPRAVTGSAGFRRLRY